MPVAMGLVSNDTFGEGNSGENAAKLPDNSS